MGIARTLERLRRKDPQREQERMDSFRRAVRGMTVHVLVQLLDSNQLAWGPSRILRGELFDRWIESRDNPNPLTCTILDLNEWTEACRKGGGA